MTGAAGLPPRRAGRCCLLPGEWWVREVVVVWLVAQFRGWSARKRTLGTYSMSPRITRTRLPRLTRLLEYLLVRKSSESLGLCLCPRWNLVHLLPIPINWMVSAVSWMSEWLVKWLNFTEISASKCCFRRYLSRIRFLMFRYVLCT